MKLGAVELTLKIPIYKMHKSAQYFRKLKTLINVLISFVNKRSTEQKTFWSGLVRLFILSYTGVYNNLSPTR